MNTLLLVDGPRPSPVVCRLPLTSPAGGTPMIHADRFFAQRELGGQMLVPQHDTGRSAAAHVIDGQLEHAVDETRHETGQRRVRQAPR